MSETVSTRFRLRRCSAPTSGLSQLEMFREVMSCFSEQGETPNLTLEDKDGCAGEEEQFTYAACEGI